MTSIFRQAGLRLRRPSPGWPGCGHAPLAEEGDAAEWKSKEIG